MVLKYNTNAKLLFYAMLGSILIVLACLIFTYNPLEALTLKLISFYPGSMAFKLWENPPYELLVTIYPFNVTNADEFLNGEEKLRFNEIGPYVYREILYNINSTFNENGTLTFAPRRKLEFVPEYSIGDPHVDTLLSPNIPLLGIAASLYESSIFVNLAVASASSYLGSQAFVNLTINEYLYGYDDSLVTLANNVVPNWIDFPRFGILDRLMALDNGSDIVTMNLKPGNDNRMYSVDKWNGSPGFAEWAGNDTLESRSNCNVVAGTYMGTVFPPNLEENTTYRLYRHAFCRPVPVKYERRLRDKNGFEGFLLKGIKDFLGRPESNPDNDCYCANYECIDGLGDMSPCYYGIPIAMSMPHFLNADPMLLEQVNGLSPNESKHDYYMLIHEKMGVPLEVKFRLQINLRVPETQYNLKTKPFNNLVLPLFWVELSVDSPPAEVKFYITLLYHVLPVIQLIAMYCFALCGVIIIFSTALATLLNLFNVHLRSDDPRRRVQYSEIPVFSLKRKVIKPEVLMNT